MRNPHTYSHFWKKKYHINEHVFLYKSRITRNAQAKIELNCQTKNWLAHSYMCFDYNFSSLIYSSLFHLHGKCMGLMTMMFCMVVVVALLSSFGQFNITILCHRMQEIWFENVCDNSKMFVILVIVEIVCFQWIFNFFLQLLTMV